MPFRKNKLKTPYLTVDGIVEIYEHRKLKGIVLIERKNEPKGLALPGGFVDYGESLENAVRREIKEETGLDAKIIGQFRAYSEPDRDPRFHTVSVIFIMRATGKPKAESDAKRAEVFPLNKIPFEKLVFDHNKILRDYLEYLEERG